MTYVEINEKKRKGKSLLRFLRNLDENREYIGFMDETRELEKVIDKAMNAPRSKSGNSLRERLLEKDLIEERRRKLIENNRKYSVSFKEIGFKFDRDEANNYDE